MPSFNHCSPLIALPLCLARPCRRRGGITPEDLASLRQPTWCRLLPQHFPLLLDQGSQADYPETLLLISREVVAGNATATGSSSASGSEGGDSSGSGSVSGGTDEYGVPDAVSQALAEAALMVADSSAHQTAAAVSDLTAVAGNASRDGPAALGAQSVQRDGKPRRQQQPAQRQPQQQSERLQQRLQQQKAQEQLQQARPQPQSESVGRERPG